MLSYFESGSNSFVVEEYMKCGDYHKGVARVKCTNPECNHDFFVPFSCKQFLFCPGCNVQGCTGAGFDRDV